MKSKKPTMKKADFSVLTRLIRMLFQFSVNSYSDPGNTADDGGYTGLSGQTAQTTL